MIYIFAYDGSTPRVAVGEGTIISHSSNGITTLVSSTSFTVDGEQAVALYIEGGVTIAPPSKSSDKDDRNVWLAAIAGLAIGATIS